MNETHYVHGTERGRWVAVARGGWGGSVLLFQKYRGQFAQTKRSHGYPFWIWKPWPLADPGLPLSLYPSDVTVAGWGGRGREVRDTSAQRWGRLSGTSSRRVGPKSPSDHRPLSLFSQMMKKGKENASFDQLVPASLTKHKTASLQRSYSSNCRPVQEQTTFKTIFMSDFIKAREPDGSRSEGFISAIVFME